MSRDSNKKTLIVGEISSLNDNVKMYTHWFRGPKRVLFPPLIMDLWKGWCGTGRQGRGFPDLPGSKKTYLVKLIDSFFILFLSDLSIVLFSLLWNPVGHYILRPGQVLQNIVYLSCKFQNDCKTNKKFLNLKWFHKIIKIWPFNGPVNGCFILFYVLLSNVFSLESTVISVCLILLETHSSFLTDDTSST